MVSIVVIYVKFSIQQCLNYLSSMHSLSAAVKGSWLFLNRFLCSTCSDLQPKKLHEGHTMTWLHTCIEGLRLPHVHVGNMLHATQMNIAHGSLLKHSLICKCSNIKFTRTFV